MCSFEQFRFEKQIDFFLSKSVCIFVCLDLFIIGQHSNKKRIITKKILIKTESVLKLLPLSE